MTWHLRALTALAEDKSSEPTIGGSHLPVTPAPGRSKVRALLASKDTFTYMHTYSLSHTYIHIIKETRSDKDDIHPHR